MLRARHLPSICARTASLLAWCPQLTQSTPNQTQPWRWPCLALCQQFHTLAASSGAQVLALTLQPSLVPGAADILQAAVAGGAGLSLGEKVLCQELCVWSHRAEGYFPRADFAPAPVRGSPGLSAQFFWWQLCCTQGLPVLGQPQDTSSTNTRAQCATALGQTLFWNAGETALHTNTAKFVSLAT